MDVIKEGGLWTYMVLMLALAYKQLIWEVIICLTICGLVLIACTCGWRWIFGEKGQMEAVAGTLTSTLL